jgi:hypothetical protein
MYSTLLISSALCILSTLFILIDDFEDFSSPGQRYSSSCSTDYYIVSPTRTIYERIGMLRRRIWDQKTYSIPSIYRVAGLIRVNRRFRMTTPRQKQGLPSFTSNGNTGPWDPSFIDFCRMKWGILSFDKSLFRQMIWSCSDAPDPKDMKCPVGFV